MPELPGMSEQQVRQSVGRLLKELERQARADVTFITMVSLAEAFM